MPLAPTTPDARLVAMLDRAFAQHAGADRGIDPAELKRALGLQSEELAAELFRCFDRDGNGTISRDEFVEGVRTLVLGSEREKLEFVFRLHDHDDDGFIGPQELERMIAISMAESEIRERATLPLAQLTRAVLKEADRDGDGRISFEELELVVRRRPMLLWKMTRSEAIWIVPNEDLLAWLDDRTERRPENATATAERGVAPRVFLAAWIAATVAIVAAAFLLDGGVPNPWMRSGHALGVAIDFNGALILLPMMRRLLTRVRASFVGRAIPVDDAIDFHRIVGHTLFALSVCHGAAFVIAYALGHGSTSVLHLFATSTGLTGACLLAVFAVMWVFSLAFIRRTKRFELFYFTHLLYVAWFALAIAHGPRFALWVGVPLAGFLFEMALRRLRRGRKASVVSSHALRSGVTRLEIARPPGFQFRAGNYAFLCVPAIARHEWHPFTISSAPERPDLAFHVRALGNWTSTLRALVERTPDAPGLAAYVDGPYGTAAEDVFESQVAVLIGAGIGVTPFASVLESIVLRSTTAGRLEKVHFYWLNRDQYSFEWFAALLRYLEQLDTRSLLDVHLCMTSGRGGASALGLELARDILHTEGHDDLITGLQAHTHVGHPDWETELRSIARQHEGRRVDVYFCGPHGLATRIRPICKRLGMAFREERF